jgi:ankyrin repeat protein
VHTTFRIVLVLAAAGLPLGLSPAPRAQTADKVEFSRDIQPLLRANCYGCHGPSQQSGNFRLDRRRDSLPNRVGANGARIVPGKSAESRVYLRVAGSQAGLQMPPSGALRPEEIGIIKAWIDQGAEWPDHLAGETPSPPQDAVAAQLMDALRRGDRRTFERLLTGNPKAARATGSGGITPLMYAALYGDVASARQLLDKGADPNARNDAGSTALLWAVDDPDTTRLLLERGADPNVRSADGRTPVLLASARSGASEVVRLLLDRGATLKGEPVLSQAADTGDAALMRLLIARGADTSALPGDLSLRSGCADCSTLLLELADLPALTRALEAAARFGDSAGVRMLLDRGAAASGPALRAAAASERVPIEAVTALLERGARDAAALDLARRHGETEVVAALRKAGANERPLPTLELKRPAVTRAIRQAIEASVPLLQRADTVFLEKAGCLSCHNNSLFQMTAATVRAKGFRLDETAARAQAKASGAYLESWRERVVQDVAIPGRVDTAAYILAGLAAAQYPPDPAIDALARYVRRRQAADGGWRIASQRPPIESSDMQATALAVRALQAYAPRPQQADYARAVQQGGAWLAAARPGTTEDHVFHLLGLHWARGSQPSIRNAARALIALQRADGGWGQVPTLGSDAYATGQALHALAAAGVVTPTDAVYQRGVKFLLDTQLEDGSWFVRSRAFPIQPYFDSGFPHGVDQFISAAATNWATMALAWAVR